MSTRPAAGRGLFYTRDSMGRSDLAPPQYVAWAQAEAARLGVAFSGTPDAMTAMMARNASAEGDLFLDYGIAGNVLSRPGFDAFRAAALRDHSVSHLFVPRRDRIARPDNPVDGFQIEADLREGGLTLVFMNKVALPLARGQRVELSDLLSTVLDYSTSGEFRRELAEKLIHAKIRLAGQGFAIGGEPPYGFRRWLCSTDGVPKRELGEREIVKLPGHHVVWLPTAEGELAVVRRILELIETTPASRIATLFNQEGIPSPNAGRTYTVSGVAVPVSGLWTRNTVRNIATHPALVALMEYGRRGFGDQLRFTPAGPRPLGEGDFGRDNKPKQVTNPADRRMTAPVPVDRPPVITPEKRDAILAVVAERGKNLKGKPRTRADAPNPLGGRIYDLNCGWRMYRYARRGKWCYACGLYQNSEAQCCDHNVVAGLTATRFVLACLQQRLHTAGAVDKLKARLRELAAAELGGDPTAGRREAARAELARVKRQLETAGRNMALAEDDDQREAMRATFNDLKAEGARLERELARSPAADPGRDPEREVEAALAGLDQLTEWAAAPTADFAAVGEVFRQVDAKLYLRFRQKARGRQVTNVPNGGVLTFGATPPPGPLYEGPVDRPVIRKMLAAGEPVSPVLGNGSPGQSEAGQSVGWSANVKRGTCYLTPADEATPGGRTNRMQRMRHPTS